MTCHGKFCTLISEAGAIDRILSRNLGTSLLSNEFKVLAAIMSEPRCVIKDLPALTGLSNRTVYDIITHLQENGVLTKSRDVDDKRFHLVDLALGEFKARICDHVSRSAGREPDCTVQADVK